MGASNFIPLLQLGTLAGFTSLFGLSLFPFIMASVIFCNPCNSSLFACLFSISSLYHFLMGSIFFLNKLHDFHSSDCSAMVMASVFLEHDPILLPLVSRCTNVGMLHKEHSSSQSSLWDKSQNIFLKVSSPKVSSTIFTILSIFWNSSLRN